jgi:hypothetical protein
MEAGGPELRALSVEMAFSPILGGSLFFNLSIYPSAS